MNNVRKNYKLISLMLKNSFKPKIKIVVMCKKNRRDLTQKEKKIFFQNRIEQFLSEGKNIIIPAEEGKLRKVEQELDFTLKNIDLKRQVVTSNPTLATGLIFMED